MTMNIDGFSHHFVSANCVNNRAFPLDHQNALLWKTEPLRMAVLALGGEKRFGPHMMAMLEEFASDVSGGSILDCGHYPADEKPTAVLEFLA